MSGSEATPEVVQAEVEAWLREHWDPDRTVRDWWRLLHGAGLAAPRLDPPYGRGYDGTQAAATRAAIRHVGVMGPAAGIGRSMVLPTILAHGTPEQIDRFVPAILDGTEGWCQLFSEPGAGSDLAGLQTRAERDGDEWVVTGQKVWTSSGQNADLAILIARTDPAQPKHEGITFFLLPMRQSAVDVRPLREMTGHAVFNEVFIDGARVDDSHRLGDVNAGWTVANTTLAKERRGIGGATGGHARAVAGSIAGHLDRPCSEFLSDVSRRRQGGQGHIPPGRVDKIIGAARSRDALDDPLVRQQVAELHTRVAILGWSAQRAKGGAGGRTGVEGSTAKIAMTETVSASCDLGAAIYGPEAQLWKSENLDLHWFQEQVLFSPAPGIYGGTDQIQRNIIGERGHGLPKEPGHPRSTPFNELPANATR